MVLELAKYQLCLVNIPHAVGPSQWSPRSAGWFLAPHALRGGINRAKRETQHCHVSPGDSDMFALVIKIKHLHQDAEFS